MKLEFKQNTVPNILYHELGYKRFLELFNIDMPIIPHKILSPLEKSDGERYFRQLSDLVKDVSNSKIDLKQIITHTSQLPSLDFLLPFFQNSNLEQYHLHMLGQFIVLNNTISRYELSDPVASCSFNALESIHQILNKYTRNSFSALVLNKDEKNIQSEISKLKSKQQKEIQQLEKLIFEETETKFIYPYPKEIPLNDKHLAKLKKCKHLSLNYKGDFILVDYAVSKNIKSLEAEINQLKGQFDNFVNKMLEAINNELKDFYNDFNIYYQERKNRSFYYAVIEVMQKYNLCIPTFTDETGLTINQGQLPILSEQKKEQYVPLNVEITRGSNLLFGANMSGKTTTLKTVYFLLSCIRMGLPVPAKNITLNFPEELNIHLRSAGNIRKNLSTFGEEIDFFTHKLGNGAYLLVDELFQSTNPVTGAKLSQIFLEDLNSKDVIFFCTSQYPETLYIKDISLLQMKDIDLNIENIEQLSINDLILKTPYEVERIKSDKIDSTLKESVHKPLLVALHFPLPKNIKDKIKTYLKGIQDGTN